MTPTRLPDELLPNWEIDPPFTADPVANELGINSQNQILQAANGRFLLKTTADSCRKSLIETLQIQDYCSEKGAPVPKVLRTREDHRLVQSHGGNCYALMEFVHSEVCSPTTRLTRVAESLAHLNRVLADCPTVPALKPGYENLNPEELREIEGAAVKASDPFAQTVTEFLRLRKAVRLPAKIISPTRVVHLDVHPDNVRFPAGRPAVIIDFGHVQTVPRMLALSFCCHRFAGFDRVATDRFFSTYSSIDSLEPEEIRQHWLFLSLECIRRIHYLLRQHYFEHNVQWDFELPRKLDILRSTLSLLD